MVLPVMATSPVVWHLSTSVCEMYSTYGHISGGVCISCGILLESDRYFYVGWYYLCWLGLPNTCATCHMYGYHVMNHVTRPWLTPGCLGLSVLRVPVRSFLNSLALVSCDVLVTCRMKTWKSVTVPPLLDSLSRIWPLTWFLEIIITGWTKSTVSSSWWFEIIY